MPVWLIRLLPYAAAALALIAAVWYIDHRGYKRAEAEATARDTQRKLDLQEFNTMLAEQARRLEGSMQAAINQSDARLVQQLHSLEVTNRTIIQPTLTKEIQREVRFTDPAAGITDIMRQELNRARGFSQQRPCPAGSNAVACFALPAAEPAPGQ